MFVLNLINCWNKIWDKLCWVVSVVALVYYDKTARESTGSHGWVSPYRKWNLAGHLVLACRLRHTCNARCKLHEATHWPKKDSLLLKYLPCTASEVSFFLFFFFFKRKLISLLSKKTKQKNKPSPSHWWQNGSGFQKCSTWHYSEKDYFHFQIFISSFVALTM